MITMIELNIVKCCVAIPIKNLKPLECVQLSVGLNANV